MPEILESIGIEISALKEKIDRLTYLVEEISGAGKLSERNRKHTTNTAAKYLGLSIETLKKWRKQKINLKFYREGGRYFYLQGDLDDYELNKKNKGGGV